MASKGGSSGKEQASSKGGSSGKAEASSKSAPHGHGHAHSHELTAGWLRVDGVNGGPRFHFFGHHFFLAGTGADAGNCRPQQCLPCQKGNFSVESQFSGNNTFGIGPSIVNNQYYETISYAGSLHLVGQGTLSDTRGSTDSRKSRAIVLAPFTLTGNLVGLDGPEGIQDKPELFNLSIHGSGIAVVELDVDTSSPPGFLYNFRSVTYDITHFTLPAKL
jgi:hypothetical protein